MDTRAYLFSWRSTHRGEYWADTIIFNQSNSWIFSSGPFPFDIGTWWRSFTQAPKKNIWQSCNDTFHLCNMFPSYPACFQIDYVRDFQSPHSGGFDTAGAVVFQSSGRIPTCSICEATGSGDQKKRKREGLLFSGAVREQWVAENGGDRFGLARGQLVAPAPGGGGWQHGHSCGRDTSQTKKPR